MKLEKAKRLGEKFLKKIQPFCKRSSIAGSTRRKEEEVNDVDLVCSVEDREGS